MKNRVLSILAVTVLCMAFLLTVACGNQATSSSTTTQAVSSTTAQTTTTEAKKEPVTLTFSTFNGWGTAEYIKLGIQKYQDASGNKVDIQLYPDDQFSNLIKAKLATGDVPDIISIQNGQDMIPMDTLEPLDGPWVSNLIPAAKKNATRVSDGAIVNAPFDACPFLGIIYNKEVMQKAGVTVPFKTYTEFLDGCEKLKKAGITPILCNGKDSGDISISVGTHYIFEKNPTLAADIMANKIKPSESPELVDAFSKITDKINKDYVDPNYKSLDGMAGLKAVSSGTAAMFFNGSWCYGIIKQNFPGTEDKCGMMPFTYSDDYISVTQLFNGKAFQVPKAAKNKETAKEMINFILQPDVLKAMYELSPGIAPYNGVDTKASSWETEISGYATQYNWPRKDGMESTYFAGFDLAGSELGIQEQAILFGKDVKKALDDWYQKISEINKTKGTTGW